MRQNGLVQDLRAPLEPGQRIQILTTRDAADPDALAVLRHSSAHLLAEAVRRLYPGVKVAIGPPIENGFYYDFEFPEPIHEADLERIEQEILKELKEGRTWERRGDLARGRTAALPRRERGLQGRARRHGRGPDLALHAGCALRRHHLHRPVPRAAPPGLAPDQGAPADRPRRRVLARRREEHAADADLRHRVLLAGRPRRLPRAARGGEAARPSTAGRAAGHLPLRRPLTRLAALASRREWSSGTSSRRCVRARTRSAATSRSGRRSSRTPRPGGPRGTSRSTRTSCSSSRSTGGRGR